MAPRSTRGPPSSSAWPPPARSTTAKRKFIIADTPGHEQYTRNMVTGASTADLALVLIDARKGVLEQSRRHAFIASLLRIPHLVGCAARRHGHRVHPGLGAARRQRGGALSEHAVVRRTVAALPARARARGK